MTYEIDGTRFFTLEEFYDEVSGVLPDVFWGTIWMPSMISCAEGFGTPEEGIHSDLEEFGFVSPTAAIRKLYGNLNYVSQVPPEQQRLCCWTTSD
jgi:hypothetical protein